MFEAVTPATRSRARELYTGSAGGNAVVVRQMLAEGGVDAGVRSVQRAVAEKRREQRVAQVATVRYETEPGGQMQIDFGEKWVSIAGELVRVFVLVAVLGYSRRLFAKAFLNQRSDDWREGIACAFRYFGGVTRTMLGDNGEDTTASERDSPSRDEARCGVQRRRSARCPRPRLRHAIEHRDVKLCIVRGGVQRLVPQHCADRFERPTRAEHGRWLPNDGEDELRDSVDCGCPRVLGQSGVWAGQRWARPKTAAAIWPDVDPTSPSNRDWECT